MNKKSLLGLIVAAIALITVGYSMAGINMMNNQVKATSKVTNVKEAVNLADKRYGKDNWTCYGDRDNGYMTRDDNGRACYVLRRKSGQNKEECYVYPNGTTATHRDNESRSDMGC